MKDGIPKLVLLGESTVGKSTLSLRFVRDIFTENQDSTIGAGYLVWKKNDKRIDIWDTAGQERYLSLSTLYYRDADIVLLVFDLTKEKTIDRLEYYIDKLLKDKRDPFKCIVIGNKLDLAKDINLLEMDKKLKERFDQLLITIEDYHYVSAKTRDGIDLLEDTIFRLYDHPDIQAKAKPQIEEIVIHDKKGKFGCC